MIFAILGPLDVRDAADRPLAIRRRKARTLLAAMLCHRDRDVPSYRLTDWLWGVDPPASALANLHSYVSDLRRVLAATAAAGSLHTTDQGYLLQLRGGQLDVDRFEELAEAGARALDDGDASVAAEHLGQAAGLWRGDVLAGVALPAAARSPLSGLAVRRLEVLTGHAQARLSLGRHEEVAIELATVTRRFPRHEPLWRLLMLSYAHGGRPGDAQATYEELCAALETHGVQPSPETNALRERIRHNEIPPVRVGRARLRWPAPRQLAAAPQRFVGRDAELAALDEAAARSRLVTIVGGPGIGKTGLALTWAHRIADRYPDGQLQVALHGHTGDAPADTRAVLAMLLRAVGAPDPASESLPEASAALRTALSGRRMLMVLDDAVSEAQVRPLLPGVASCLTVVTSRNRLDGLVAREGATRLRLGRLAPIEARRLLLDLRDPLYGSDDGSRLAELCDYLPLALRIVAATGHDIDPLVTSDGERCVRSAFDVSYSRLPESQQQFFRALGRSPATLTRMSFTAAEVAMALALDRTQVYEMLDQLDRVGLVARVGRDRFQLAAMARRYAAQLAAAVSPVVRRRGAPAAWRTHCPQRSSATPVDAGLKPAGDAPGWPEFGYEPRWFV